MTFVVNGICSESATRSYSETETARCNQIGPMDVRASTGPAPRGDVERNCRAVVRVTAAKLLKLWSGRRGSNPRRPAWEAGILPLNYSRPLFT
jgi:hypothetical protein